MPEKDEKRTGHDSGRLPRIRVVGIGPGGAGHLTEKAKEAIGSADAVVGYTRYVELVSGLLAGKEVFSTGMTREVERCRKAIELARAGRTVAVVSSGDAGIYGMAGLVLELLDEVERAAVEVVPGVPAFVAASALLGAPLMHDFASISLSDLLTDWAVIEKRLEAAAQADFVIALYNPKSTKRVEGLGRALEIIGRHRGPSTPVGIVRNATREDEQATLTTLKDAPSFADTIDMLTILIIGNSSSYSSNGRFVTPRGYRLEKEGR